MHDKIYSGEISALAFGGDGIVRDDGLVVFVPFTAPGDLISYTLTKKKKNHAFGHLVSIERPSPERTLPKCPYFGVCGGCQLQHLHYSAQLEYKKQQVVDALKRIGGMDVEVPVNIVPSEHPWGYRRHITLTLQAYEGHFQAGYIARDHSLLPINECPIFVEKSDPIIEQVQAAVGQMKSSPQSQGRVVILKDGKGGYILTFHFDQIPPNVQQVISEAMSRFKGWSGVICGSKRYGKTKVTYAIEDLSVSLSPEAFMQNNAEQSLNIYRELLHLALQSGPKRMLDLYCGVGISTLLLAKQGIAVLGVEGNPVAIQLAKQNALENGVKDVDFHSRTAPKDASTP